MSIRHAQALARSVVPHLRVKRCRSACEPRGAVARIQAAYSGADERSGESAGLERSVAVVDSK